MTASALAIEQTNGIAHLRFNRPGVLNALDAATAQAFVAACRALASDPTVRVVVLSGAGPAFMAGGDLAALRADPIGAARALIGPMHEGVRLLMQMSAPVIASVHGAVAGAGWSLALAADLALAAEGTRFNLAYVNIGTSCDLGASWSLPRLVGLRKALEIALLAETIDAAEALRLGLVQRVVPLSDLVVETSALARRLAAKPPAALGHLKRLMRASSERSLQAQLEAEQDAFLDCAGRSEFTAAIDKFFAERVARSANS